MTDCNQKNNTLVFREFAINCDVAVLHPKPSLVSIINGIFVLPFQQMLSPPHINANLVALRSPLIRLAECSHLEYSPLQIQIPSRRAIRPQTTLQKFLAKLKRLLFSVSNVSGRVGSRIPHNNIWSCNLQFNAHCQQERKTPPKLDNNCSGLQLHIAKVISTKLYCINMSLKSLASNRVTAKGYQVIDNVSIECRNAMSNIQQRTPQPQALLTQLVYSLAKPFCESSSNVAKSTTSGSCLLSASDATQAPKEERCEAKVICVHPVQLGTWHGRQRTTSELSDNICFLDSDFDDESTNASDSYEDDTESEEECGSGSDETDDDEVTQRNSSDTYSMKELTTKKKVRFNLKPDVHIMYAWNFAYRSARKGNWESYALDRSRFQLRIQRAAFYLDPILNAEHRKLIYNSRFADTL